MEFVSGMDLTKPGVALTDVILTLFRVNSLLLMRGDRLVAGLGLTSARWQISGLSPMRSAQSLSPGSLEISAATARTCSGL